MEVIQLNIPIEVANDNYLRTYKKLEGDKVVAYYERIPTAQDQTPVFNHGELVIKPVYLGEWQDKTAEYLELEAQKKAKLKAERARAKAEAEGRELTDEEFDKIVKGYRPRSQNRPAGSETREEIIIRQLKRAEELLALLKGGR